MNSKKPEVDVQHLFEEFERMQVHVIEPALMEMAKATGRGSFSKMMYDMKNLQLLMNDEDRCVDYHVAEVGRRANRIFQKLDTKNSFSFEKCCESDIDAIYLLRPDYWESRASFDERVQNKKDLYKAIIMDVPAYNPQQLLLKKATVALCDGNFRKASADLKRLEGLAKDVGSYMEKRNNVKLDKQGQAVDISMKDKWLNPKKEPEPGM